MKTFVLTCLVFGLALTVRAAEQTPVELQGIGVEEHLGSFISLDLPFKDEKGKTLPLKTFFAGGKPVILALVYYECPNLCTFLLNGAIEGFKNLAWTIGDQFEFVALSIDPSEKPDLAAKKKESYLKEYWRLKEAGGDRGRGPAKRVAEEVPEGVAGGVHFLTGETKNIKKLAQEFGFQYRYDAEQKQYAHPAALFVLTPGGKIARVLGGIEFPARNLRLALVEASQGKIGTVVDQLLLFCFRYDPKTHKYSLFASNLMKAGGVATVLMLGVLVYGLKKKGSS